MSECKQKDCNCWMADECLKEVKDALSELGINMDNCPPMLYRQAMNSLFSRTAKASAECVLEHEYHGGDQDQVTKCLVEKIRSYKG